MNRKVFIAVAVVAISLPLFIINLQALKSLFGMSWAGEFYVTHFRDGKDVDQDHLITTLRNGMSIIVNKFDRCVCWQVRLIGYWDSSETKVVNRIIKKDFKVVEVGSNFGVHTLKMAELVGEHGKIYAFEANPNVSKYLKQSIAMNKMDERVKVFEMALSNKNYNGFMTYGVTNIGGGYIFAEGKEAECAAGSCLPIQVRVLDDVLPQKKIDVLKMDAEGSEFWIMEGAKSLLDNPDLTLIMEWSTPHLTRNGVDIERFINLLKENNFYAWSIERGGKLKPQTFERLANNATFDLVFSRDPNKFKDWN